MTTEERDGLDGRGGTVWERGVRMRLLVLGAEHVDRSLDKATEFSRPMQDLVTEFCWGAVWSRQGLDPKTRSLLNIAMLTALGRRPELRLHIGGALTNGATPEEIREVLLQASVYCGMPAGIDAFRLAEEVLVEQGIDVNATPERRQADDERGRP